MFYSRRTLASPFHRGLRLVGLSLLLIWGVFSIFWCPAPLCLIIGAAILCANPVRGAVFIIQPAGGAVSRSCWSFRWRWAIRLLGMEAAGPGQGQGLGLSVVSWNLNGIRARGDQLRSRLLSLGAQIICLQETRVSRDLLEEGTAILEGFNSYFSHSRARTGYSGVATYCMDNAIPLTAEEGLSGLLANQAVPVPHWLAEEFSEQELRELDNEGRALITKHRIRLADGREEMLAVINVYCPRADPESEHRCRFKLRFYQLLQAKAQALLRHGENVLILGDLNTAHRPIDHCEPGDLEQFCAQPGRLWMDGFVSYALGEEKEWGGGGGLFVDAFRLFHPSQRDAYTCWCVNTGARQTNYGTRIDYILASHALALGVLRDCILLPEVQGSDHCPVKAWLRADCLPADRCPPLCTRYMPEFAGVQQKLSRFLVAQPSHCPASPEVLPAKVAKPQRQVGRGKRGKGRPIPNGSLLAFFKPVTSCKPSTPTPSPPLGGEVNSSPGRQKEAPIDFWKGLLKGRPLPPHCSRHQEPCILRTVKKAGPNQGRDFYACQRPKGAPHNPASRCDFFRWADTSS